MFRKRIIALSIEGTTLRLVSSRGDSVEIWDSIPFAPHFVRGGHVADSQGLGAVIRNALAKRKISKGKVVCALSAAGTTSRIINLPRVGRGKLEGIVDREVRRLVGASAGNSYIHWRALAPAGDQQQVYLLTVPRRPLHALVRAVRAAGLNISLIDLKPLALMKAVNRRDAIIANAESNSVDVIVMLDDVPVIVQSAVLGEEMLSADYAIGRISDELVRAISSYNDGHRDSPLDPEFPVYLTGTVAGSMAFALNVSTLTGRPIGRLGPPLRYPAELPLAHYMVNMGLILRAL